MYDYEQWILHTVDEPTAITHIRADHFDTHTIHAEHTLVVVGLILPVFISKGHDS